MARRENPIPPCSRSLLALVTWLRACRAEARLTYEQLASRTMFSADTLSRAASGRGVPRNLAVVLAYAQACGRSTKEAERLWKHARRDESRAQGVLSGHRSGVHISVVKDFADLHSAIVDLYHDDGSPPLRSLEARLGGMGRLPHSTVGRVLKGSSTPSRSFVAAFAEACNVRKTDLPEWTKAWDRADADRRSSRMRSPKPDHARQRLTVHDRVTPRDLQLLMSELESSARKQPALKLLVHVPDPESKEAHAAARMSRELLIDQAQRRGELACPQCHRPSFGFGDTQGWRAALCSSCAPPSAQQIPVPDEAVPLAANRLADTPTLLLRDWSAGPSDESAADTPTLSLRIPDPAKRPPLPKRTTRTWPAPPRPSSASPLNADSLITLNEPSAQHPHTPAHPTIVRADELRPLSGPTPPWPTDQSSPHRNDWFPPRMRFRINIPANRPLPPVVAPTPTPTPNDDKRKKSKPSTKSKENRGGSGPAADERPDRGR
ncbi:helix-turn-helix domain-containing protein [Streptomyces koyangensis]|uniref:helix-turn-helix domain-containing protein n=1 Tax=Streptomyces koyangensis TaxID=188770 RepID=UPI003C2DB627